KSTFAWLADEWFLIAREEVPPESHYENYPQIDNGVGSIRSFLKEFDLAAESLPKQIDTPKKLTWVVGNAVEKAFQPILERLNKVENLEITMVALCSNYWGQNITVTGLLTGSDLLLGLQHKSLGDSLLLPAMMLKHGDTCFLDDMTVTELASELNTPILPVRGIVELIETCIK
ncbi:MAG: DUF512 domain-containing protein, partial [Tatlockia sp.]|nr:DUF512 domain-containing protein [Tatlockia sp.]